MEAGRDYYDVLGVSRDADEREIRDAFRRLALRYHPDRNKEPDAEERFKEIAEAYAVLSDPAKRRDYDMRGAASVAGFSPEDLFAGMDLGDLLGGLGLGFGEDLFGGLFGRARRRRPARGEDLEVRVEIPLERVLTGGEQSVQVTRLAACDACRGSGARAGTAPEACGACGGTGQRVASRTEPGVLVRQITTCPECRGSGRLIRDPCPECAGTGTVARREDLTVRIPVGAEEGMALRVAGHGMASPETGVPPGDLFVMLHTAPDPRFARNGVDLWRAETVEVADAALGTRLRVPSLDGRDATVTVPAGTQPDTVLRMRGKGLPPLGGGPRGDLYVRVLVRVPESLTDEERALYERLRAAAPGGVPGETRWRGRRPKT
jgi:molecular chaperone DnaJ